MFEAFKATQKRRREGQKTRFIRSGTVLFLLLNGIFHKKTPIFTHLRGTTDISGSSHAPNPVKQQPRSCENLLNQKIRLLFISLLRSRRLDSGAKLRTQQQRVLPPPRQPRIKEKNAIKPARIANNTHTQGEICTEAANQMFAAASCYDS